MKDTLLKEAIIKFVAGVILTGVLIFLPAWDIPLSMLHQYMPLQYEAVRDGLLRKDPEALLADCVERVMADYEYACEAE